MFFGLSPLDLLVLAALAATLYGPDRLPQAAAQAARFLATVRTLSRQAQDELREHLGPEVADLIAQRPSAAGLVRAALAEPAAHLQDLREEVNAALTAAPEPARTGGRDIAAAPREAPDPAFHDAT